MNAVWLRLKLALIIFGIALIIGIFGFWLTEGVELIDSLYYTIVTISTVGYGDFVPHTMMGKVLSILVIILGVGSFLGVIANLTELTLSRRDVQARIKKINILVGLFFTETGCNMMTAIINADPGTIHMQKLLDIKENNTVQDLDNLKRKLKDYDYRIDIKINELRSLQEFLESKKEFIMRMLENPVLLDHEDFTELLHSIFHLQLELQLRFDGCEELSDEDLQHMKEDLERVYRMIIIEWIDYLRYLSTDYPYLFKYAIRTNPAALCRRC